MSTLWVIGDSTVSSFEDKYYYPRYGYGTMLDKYLNDNVRVVNIALSGRSSKSYRWSYESGSGCRRTDGYSCRGF